MRGYQSCTGADGRRIRIGDEIEYAVPQIGHQPTRFPHRGHVVEIFRTDVFVIVVHDPRDTIWNRRVRARHARKAR